MILHIIEAKHIRDYQLWVKFNDGVEKIVDFKNYLKSKKHPFFQSLKTVDEFKNFKICKTIYWDSGADIAPEYVYENL